MEPVYKASREHRLGPVSSLLTSHTQLYFMLAVVLLESRRVDRGAPGCSEHRSLPTVNSELYHTIVLENNAFGKVFTGTLTFVTVTGLV